MRSLRRCVLEGRTFRLRRGAGRGNRRRHLGLGLLQLGLGLLQHIRDDPLGLFERRLVGLQGRVLESLSRLLHTLVGEDELGQVRQAVLVVLGVPDERQLVDVLVQELRGVADEGEQRDPLGAEELDTEPTDASHDELAVVVIAPVGDAEAHVAFAHEVGALLAHLSSLRGLRDGLHRDGSVLVVHLHDDRRRELGDRLGIEQIDITAAHLDDVGLAVGVVQGHGSLFFLFIIAYS